jgi:8-hydroxy-5-deazaflavin:NADPH oxidoreductase
MKIGMIGTGNIGFSLGPLLVSSGHEVRFGSRNPELVRGNVSRLGTGASLGTVREAAEFGDVLFTAVPWRAVPEMLEAAAPLTGKTIVDCTNPLTPDMGLAVGCTTSAAEETAKLCPDANVVKGFNTVFAGHYRSGDLGSDKQRLDMFFCGDDAAAKKKVAAIIESLGLIPVDAGPLSAARYIEPLAILLIRLAYVQGMGGQIAWKLVSHPSGAAPVSAAR